MNKSTTSVSETNDNYFFLLPSFGLKFGGLTGTVLKKTRLLSEEAGYSCKILCMNHSVNFEAIKKAQLKNGKLGPNVQMLNMFDYFADEKSKITLRKRLNLKSGRNIAHEYMEKSRTYRIYDKGVLVEAWIYEKDNKTLKSICFYDSNRKKYKQSTFDKYGNLVKDTHFNVVNDSITTVMYYRRDKSCYLSYWYNDDNKVNHIVWFDKKMSIKEVFKNEAEIQKYYLDRQVSSGVNNYFVSEKRWYDSAVIKMKNRDNVYKIMSHHGHLYPRIPGSFKFVDEIDKFVVLTEWYKKDIIEKHPENKKIVVVPNSFNGPTKMPDFDKRDIKKVISTSRYVKIKQLDHTIKSFRKVVDKIPEAVLELYGHGDEGPNLKKLITDLELEDNVKIKGFTPNVSKVYQSAAISVSSSRTEGFSLSILESLSNACPVVCYNIRYSPSDMITSGNNGYLVEENDIDDLADKIIKSINNKQNLKKMSAAAYKNAKKFNDSEWTKSWIEIFESMKK